MNDYIDIPQYPKNNIDVVRIEVLHGNYFNMSLKFKNRTDCLEAVRFLTEIIDNMIDHSYREKE